MALAYTALNTLSFDVIHIMRHARAILGGSRHINLDAFRSIPQEPCLYDVLGVDKVQFINVNVEQ